MNVTKESRSLVGWTLLTGYREFVLSANEVLIGRDETAEVRLEDDTVSRKHARLFAGPSIEDLHSSNGTLVNGKRITTRIRLNEGDRITIGRYSMTLVRTDGKDTFEGYTRPMTSFDEKAKLTPREQQVFELFTAGLSQKSISSQLGISVKTVETYRTRIGHKLGLATRADLVQYALKEGMLK